MCQPIEFKPFIIYNLPMYIDILQHKHVSDYIISDKYHFFLVKKLLPSFKFATEFMKSAGCITSFQCPAIKQERMRLASLLFQSLG